MHARYSLQYSHMLHSMRHSPHTGRGRPDKALGIRFVRWFPTILSLLDVIIPKYNISSDPRSRSGDEKERKKIPWIQCCDATYCPCLLQMSNFHACGTLGTFTPLHTSPKHKHTLSLGIALHHTTQIWHKVQVLAKVPMLQGLFPA
jgi:hypothetical protein